MADNNIKGTPIKDRSEDEVRETLEGQDEYVIQQWLWLWRYMVDNNLGTKRAADQVDMSPSSISECFNGGARNNLRQLAERIEAFAIRQEQRKQFGAIEEFRETQLSGVLFSVFEQTRAARRIQVVQGPEQMGKTRIGKEFTARNNHRRTRFFELFASITTKNQLIHEFSHMLDIDYSAKLSEKKFRIKERLELCDLLIIDEAHLLFKWSNKEAASFLDYLRTDLFQNGKRGVVLLCTDDKDVGEFMDGLRRLKDNHYNVGQFLGRMRHRVRHLDAVEDLTPDDIRMLVERYYTPGQKTFERIVKLAHTEGFGHLGLVLDIVSGAQTRAAGIKKPLTDKLVDEEIDRTQRDMKQYAKLYI